MLWIDIETYSETPIADGTDNYARDAEIMLVAYAIGDAPVRLWDATETPDRPADLSQAIDDQAALITAHNAAFERTVFHYADWGIDPSRYRCTMAQALAHGLPGALEKLCDIFGIAEEQAKLKDSKQLIHLFCKPQPKGRKLRRATRETHPAEWERFKQYCINDVEAMRAVAKKMPNWNYSGDELALWQRDQRINHRGILIDLDLVNSALETAQRVKSQLAERAQELTDGEIAATTQRDALLTLLNEGYDLGLPDLRGSTVEKLLKSEADLPPVLRELLENRLAASSTSVSKYKRFKQLTSPDGRLRNTLQFCGASRTGRWAGRGVQLQNLPRPSMKQKAIDSGIEALKADCADLICEKPMELMQSAVRGCIIAPPGKKLVVADLSNIEGRMLAWLAGEEWKLKAFADFDAGTGHDLYALAYAKAFNITPEEVMENKKSGDGSFRQIGKVMELFLQYAGGVGAFITGGLTYGIDLDKMATNAAPNIPPQIMREAEKAYDWAAKNNRTFGLAPLTYAVCDSFKRLWREAHPAICKFWKALEQAVRAAILQPERKFAVRSLRVLKTKAWLRIVLPSGRSLCYPAPKIDEENKISYMGINQYSRKWQRLKTYSGKLCLAKDTSVLTYRGWIPIQSVTEHDLVWDGDAWVSTGGAVCNGRKHVIEAHGAWMTHDHLVLTEKGWKSASQSGQYRRHACGLPDGYQVPRAGEGRCAGGIDRPAGCDTEVFDLLDCGPRHRFVIAASTGGPLIVHNCENVTQAASRDVIAFNLPHVEAAGYEVLVTVHDEDITEAPDTPEYNADHLASIMATNPPWAKGLPLAADGFEAYRYRK